jgi:hypothetical protein
MTSLVKKSSSTFIPFMLIWAVYITFYIFLKNQQSLHLGTGVLSFIALMGLDIFLACYAFRLVIISTDKSAKRIFYFLAVSFVCLFFDDLIYSVLYSLMQLPRAQAPVKWVLLDNLFYIGYLFFQFLAWINIFIKAKSPENKFSFYMPVLFITGCIGFVFVLMLKNNMVQFTGGGIADNVETFLHLITFVIAALCLTIANNKGVFYLAVGYLVGIASDLVMDLGLLGQTFGINSILETSWIFTLLFMGYGLLSLNKSESYKKPVDTWVYKINSLRAQLAFWIFAICAIVFSVFFMALFLFTPHSFF